MLQAYTSREWENIRVGVKELLVNFDKKNHVTIAINNIFNVKEFVLNFDKIDIVVSALPRF